MNEFANRLDAQRQVLDTVNCPDGVGEELCGLSKKAIERWLRANRISETEPVAGILFQISSKLFFLASKSQEQVTEDYRHLSREIERLRLDLRNEFAKFIN